MPKRMRRAYLKRFSSSVVKGSSGPKMLVLDDRDASKDRDRLWAYHARVRTTKGRKDDREHISDNTFMPYERWQCMHCGDTGYLSFVCKKCRVGGVHPRAEKIVETKIPKTNNVKNAKHPKQDVEDKRQKILWQSDRLQGVEDFYCSATLHEHRDWSLKLYSCGDKCMLVEEDQNMKRQSCLYTKTRAIELSQGDLGKVLWLKYETKSSA